MAERPAYNGEQRKLVLAFDIGTTYSGVSYCVLDPGNVPEIRNVTKFPAQEGVGGDSKIPSIILYGPEGEVRAVGAEVDEVSAETIETEHLFRSEWFKLHMRPRHLHKSDLFNHLPPLPPRKDAMVVFADYLRYLFNCAKDFIVGAHFNGAQIWESSRDIILTHPNGWEGAQQAMMREAAIIAEVVPDTAEGRDSVHFVTEGEASLHFCIFNGIVPNELKKDDAILVIDAGGGTIDISGYKKKADDSLLFEEAAAPECHFRGSIFVTQFAKIFLRNSLQGSKYHDVVDDIAKCFDKSTKLRFRDKRDPSFIKFGTMRDRDPEYNIRSGQLKLEGEDVARFFEPSITCIARVIGEAKYHKQIKAAFLVGGFAANDWLFNSLKAKFEQFNVSIFRPEQYSSKAVSSGAISFYIDHYVDSRVSRFCYGTVHDVGYNPHDPEHQQRKEDVYVDIDGSSMLPGSFSIILPKDIQVNETQEFRSYFSIVSSHPSHAAGAEIVCYRGGLAHPRWLTQDPEWEVMCMISADEESLSQIAVKQTGPGGQVYYQVMFEIILLFGLTEFKAQICWKEGGEEKRGPASVIYA
ncbi:hypothetical protein AX16_004346 [Volvariella volvacea WC 439]|nr:hypothetical protein AX16_004346 [Volvariella volvacea WC 439]